MPCIEYESKGNVMPNIIDHVSYLSNEIGARPGGTEEEQQAALYIAENLQTEAGLPADIEDFNAVPTTDLSRALCAAVAILFTVISLIVPVMAVPAIVLSVVAAVVFCLESFDKPVVSKLMSHGVSQNVVAKYEPGIDAGNPSSRRRKVIVVAHYDSGKVRAELNGPVLGALPILKWVELGAFAAIPLLLIVKDVFLANQEGAANIVLTVLLVVAMLLCALPLAAFAAHRFAPYSPGANCNASGVAVLMEVAARVGRGKGSSAGSDAVIHGAEQAFAADVVPEGAQLVYETPSNVEIASEPQSAQGRLAAAKAAIAALSGDAEAAGSLSLDVAEKLVQAKAEPVASPTNAEVEAQRQEVKAAFATVPSSTVEAARAAKQALGSSPIEGYLSVAESAAASASAPATEAAPFVSAPAPAAEAVPSWFTAAQEKAKRPKNDNKPAQRSRYADALDAALRDSSSHFRAAVAASAPLSETELRLQQVRESIMEVKAPEFDRTKDVLAEPSAGAAPEPAAVARPVLAQPAPAVEAAAGSVEVISPEEFQGAPASAEPVREAIASEVAQSLPAQESTTEFATCAMSPIDVTDLRAEVAAAAAPAATKVEASSLPSVSVPEPIAASVLASALPSIESSPLPSVQANPVAELKKQPAPLAEKPSAAERLRSQVPSIEPVASETAAHPAILDVSSLRSSLPSLSGTITFEGQEGASSASEIAAPEPQPSAGMTGSFTAVDENLLQNLDDDDIYVDDADDSAYEGNVTETGAFAGPGYVEMPKSRIHRFFDRFRKNKAEDESTPQEWLDVDDSFDARAVGAERGSWESFREEDGYQEDGYADEQGDCYADDYYEEDESPKTSARTWQGGSFGRKELGRVSTLSGEKSDEPPADDDVDLEPIHRFHNPDISVEVWFVALGSQLSNNGGMRAFMEEHAQDLRGAMIVEIDALGAGELSLVEKEGLYRSAKASSRLKRHLKKASQATGLRVGSASIEWADGAASYAVKHGAQAMHLVGFDGSKPARYAEADDTVEAIDEATLSKNADFVMELLKNI